MLLYGVRGWGSAISEAMLVAAGARFDFVDVNGFDRPSAARSRLLAINPLAQVPTLVLDDGSVLTETAAIALHFDTGLVPPVGDATRARFLRLLVWIVANVYPTFTFGDYPERWAPSAAAELVARTDAYRERLYAWLEDEVGDPFVLGERFSALDIYVAVMTEWRPRRPWFDAHTPKLAAIADRVRALPLLATVLAANLPDEATA